MPAGREAGEAILFKPQPRDLAAEDAAIEQKIRDYADDYLVSLGGPADIAIDISRSDTSMSPGSEVVVTIDYPYDFLLLPGFVGTLDELINIQAVSSMRAE